MKSNLTQIAVAVLAIALVATPITSFAQATAPAKTAPNEAAIAGFGGYAGLMKINLDLVARVKANALIGKLFADTDAPRLAGLLSDQFCELLGGGCKYTGNDMRAAHQGMGIKTHHFNALAEELQRAMDAAGVSQSEQFRLIAKLAPMKRDINEKPE
ncbi:MAG: group 1 truncated hemoglobin [Burkholderiales bacterium]|nr:MAG: group 1 truncated hemoglobin [Burkholderiales bacterium]TAG81550.1 MAG: group 1 truncated hemoglobin [Betaproteobacteria bacterium]